MSSQGRCTLAFERGSFRVDVDIQVPTSGITGIYGASGSGKTSLLRCIAGLEPAVSGRVVVAGQVWQDDADGRCLPVHRRRVGYVFQEDRLFPHLSAYQNLLFGWRRRESRLGAISAEEVIDWLGLSPLLGRRPHQLSGGERQRVAIGRALLGSPELLLMDEPLANIDVSRRGEILPFLERLHAETSLPIFFVSHHLDEIVRLCDRMIVMDQGKVIAEGDLNTVLTTTEHSLIAGEQASALIEARIEHYDEDYELTTLSSSAGNFHVAGRQGEPGQKVRIRIMASDVSICLSRPSDSSIRNILPAMIEAVVLSTGPQVTLLLSMGDEKLLARISRKSHETLGLSEGKSVFAQIKSAAVRYWAGG